MIDPKIHDSSYSWFRLAITLTIAIFANTGMWAVITIMPALAAEFVTSRALTSLPFTFNMIGFAVGNLVIGVIIDRFGITISIISAALLSGLAYLLSTQADSIYFLSIVHLMLGFGCAAGFGPLITDISHWFLRRRGIAVALTASGNYLAGAIWPALLSGVLATHGWREVYITLAIITVVVIIPLAFLLRRTVPESAHNIAAEKVAENTAKTNLSPRRLQILLSIAGVSCCVAMSMPQVHIVSYCVGLGYGPAIGAQMLSLMLFGGVFSRVISGLAADKIGGIYTLLIGSSLQCLALLMYLPFDGMASLYVVSLIFGLAQGGIVPSYAVIVREYLPPKEAGARVGFVIMMTIIGMALGGWMSGWIYELTGSYQMAFINGIIWNGLNMAIILWILLRGTKQRPQLAAG
ncbi:MAG: MFS transporter [Alphaproteobacteria bacterium]|nr:MFS transporter [Alphaproteobacteria bacterium]